MRRWLLALVVSCAPIRAAEPPKATATLPPPPVAVVVDSPPPKASRCVYPRVPAAPAPKATEPSCNLLPEKAVIDVEKTLRTRFAPTSTTHKLVVDFGCDEVDDDVRTIEFEDGSGHGGSLRIFRLTALPGPTPRYDVRAIAYASYYNAGFAFARTEIDGTNLVHALEKVRVAMVARLHDVMLLAANGSIGGLSASFSSNDFHLRIRLEDTMSRALDRSFTGYDSSYDQESRLPMQLASEPVLAAIAGVQFAPGVPTAQDRELFQTHFARTFAAVVPWWIAERMLEMAPTLGSNQLVPAIISWLKHSDPKGSGMERIRGKAVAALVAITGLDLRKDAEGADRPLEEVVREYVAECE